jgi:hypothetical protein
MLTQIQPRIGTDAACTTLMKALYGQQLVKILYNIMQRELFHLLFNRLYSVTCKVC